MKEAGKNDKKKCDIDKEFIRKALQTIILCADPDLNLINNDGESVKFATIISCATVILKKLNLNPVDALCEVQTKRGRMYNDDTFQEDLKKDIKKLMNVFERYAQHKVEFFDKIKFKED